MSSMSKAVDKWKDRWKAKGGILKGGLKEGSPIDPIGATLRSATGNEVFSERGSSKESIEAMKETSRPDNNALTVAMTPDIPVPEKQPIIPIPDEQAQADEARRRRARQSRTGRNSTILTGLGG